MATPGSVLVFWDYDTQWGGDRSRMEGGPKDWGHLEFEHTERLLELHAEYGVPACFAVVGAAALPGDRPYHDPAQIRRLHEAGHEVASHSFQHDWLPALHHGALLETLRRSKDALEQCIGAGVVSFVPPYNQPFDYAAGLSISLSERRQVKDGRTDISRLCSALHATGYKFCRVAFRRVWEQIGEQVFHRMSDRPANLLTIRQVRCVRLNAPGGFNAHAWKVLERTSREGGIMAVGGHPHSLRSGNSQDEKSLVPFLRRVKELQSEGRIRAMLPRQLIDSN